MARPVGLLDADVLYPARLRDLLIRLAIAGLYRARWSERILDECFANLVADRPDLPQSHLHRTRELMAIAVPDAQVTRFEHLVEEIDLPDPGDRHVLAAARAADATHLVTANLRDFPPSCRQGVLNVVSPDEFVSELLEEDADMVVAVVEAQAAALRNPPMTTTELLDGLCQVGLEAAVKQVRAALRPPP